MDFKYILSQEEKLLDYLKPDDKARLEGVKASIETLECLKSEYEEELNCADYTLDKIALECQIKAIEHCIEHLECTYAEMAVAFIDCNGYSLDAEGNVYKDDE